MSWPARQGRLGASLLTLCLWLLPAPLCAQVEREGLETAKALFRQGNALLAAGDLERALERFLASRAALASGKNTANAAICLERLGRYDEALEMYEELLSRFAADLDEHDRQNLAPTMARLRGGLGSVDLASNVEGSVTIDGKPRGRLPRSTPLRALPGKRRLRVVKDGYQTFDVVVEVRAGQTISVDAALAPLSGLGAIRVEHAGSARVRLLVDGRAVGSLPWEGTLPAGAHLLQALGEQHGSKPLGVQVVERNTQLIRLNVRALGPPLRIATSSSAAEISLDGVPLGRGAWTGRLPWGSYRIRAEEPGYFAREQALVIAADSRPASMRLDLTIDPKSPRWPQGSSLRYTLGVGGALLYAPSLSGGSEESCPASCDGSRAALGGSFEAVLEVLHERGVGAELGLGYLFARQSFTRAALEDEAIASVSYALEQQLALGGPYARAAAIVRLTLSRSFALRTALGAGILVASYDARASGVAGTTGTELAPANAFGYAPISERLPVITTGLRLERKLGPLQVWFGLDAWFVPKRGPRFPNVELAVAGTCGPSRQAVGCARTSDLLSEEPVHGLFAALFPGAGVRYRF